MPDFDIFFAFAAELMPIFSNRSIKIELAFFTEYMRQDRSEPFADRIDRKKRIAAGAGVRVEDVNKLLKSFEQMQKMIKQFSSPGMGKKMKRMSRMGGFRGGFPGF